MKNRHQLKKKLNSLSIDFISLFKEYSLKQDVEQNMFLAGGAICSLIIGDPPNDYDIFFENPTVLKKAIDYLNKNHSALILSQTENALTLRNKYQIIIKYIDCAKTLIDKFDFAHCAGYYKISTDELYIHEKMYESIASRSLIYLNSPYPVSSFFRLRKLLSNGWNIPNGQLLEMLRAIQRVDLEDLRILEDQISGLYDDVADQITSTSEEGKQQLIDLLDSYPIHNHNKYSEP